MADTTAETGEVRPPTSRRTRCPSQAGWLILLIGAPIQIVLTRGVPRVDVLARFVAAGLLAGVAAAIALRSERTVLKATLRPVLDTPRCRELCETLRSAACLIVAALETVSILAILAGAAGQMRLAAPIIMIANMLSGIAPWALAVASALCASSELLARASDFAVPPQATIPAGDSRGRALLRAVPIAFSLTGAAMRIAWAFPIPAPLLPSDCIALLGVIATELCAAALMLLDLRLTGTRVIAAPEREIGAAASQLVTTSELSGLALGAYAVGSLLSTLMLRSVLHLHVVPAGIALAAAALMFAVPLGLRAAMRADVRRLPAEIPSDEGAQDDGEMRIDSVRRMFSERGLATREAEIAALTAIGQSSEQVGARLGIKASSVRSTLHRVYRKLDVHGAGDLRACCAELLSAVPAEDTLAGGKVPSPSAQTPPSAAADGRFASQALAVRRLSGCVLLLLLYAPLISFAPWGTGRMTVLGTAMGGALFGLYHLHERMLARARSSASGDRANSQGLRLSRSMRAVLICAAVTLACVAAGAASLMRLYSSSLKPSIWSPFEFASYLLCTFALLSLSRCRAGSSARPAASGRTIAAAAPLSLLAVLLTSEDLVHLGMIALAAILLSATSLTMRTDGRGEERTDAAPAPFSFAAAVPCLMTFAGGAAWEELWRSLAMYSGILSVLPFTALLIGGAFWLRLQDFGFRELRLTLLATALSSGVFALLFGFDRLQVVLIPLATAGSIAVIAGRARLQGTPDPRAPAWMALSAAAGALGAYLIMNRVSRIMPDIFNGASIAPAQVSALALVTLAFSALFLCAGLAALALCRSIVGSERAARLVACSKLDEAELRHRLRAYFVSRGANDTQALVLTEIACGHQAAEICDRLHVSLGTVNTARNAGYRLLGVHDRLGLHSLVSQLITA